MALPPLFADASCVLAPKKGAAPPHLPLNSSGVLFDAVFREGVHEGILLVHAIEDVAAVSKHLGRAAITPEVRAWPLELGLSYMLSYRCL